MTTPQSTGPSGLRTKRRTAGQCAASTLSGDHGLDPRLARSGVRTGGRRPDVGECALALYDGDLVQWDYGLAAADTVLRRVNTYVPEAACPAEVDGGEELSVALEQCPGDFDFPQVTCPRASLVNAMEILDDHAGNDDGFCESNERCEYLPHLSNARGRGIELAPCVTEDPVGVTIVSHVD